MFFYGLMIWAMFKLSYNSIIIVILMVLGFIAEFMSGSRAGTAIYVITPAVCLFLLHKKFLPNVQILRPAFFRWNISAGIVFFFRPFVKNRR